MESLMFLCQIMAHSFQAENSETSQLNGNSSTYLHHPTIPNQSKAEATVKIVKTLFKKALKDGKDPWLTLLDYRNTPTEGIGSSPVQRIYSRRTRTLVPVATSLLVPQVIENAEEKINLKRQKAKLYHDRSAKDLPDLTIGQEVRIAPLQRNKTWETGTCVQKLSDRSYLVKTQKETVRRNRVFLKPKELAKEPPQSNITDVNPPETPLQVQLPAKIETDTKGETAIKESENRSSPTIQVETPVQPRRTSSGRVVKTPTRFQNFDMK